MGWSKKVRDFAFPLLELFRPIPILAWVPLSILLLPGFEGPVIFLATLASLFVTTLNAMLGVDSIDDDYFRAAGCLGSSSWDVFKMSLFQARFLTSLPDCRYQSVWLGSRLLPPKWSLET
jgi:NitT/TauT family transport system permease protein